MFLFNEKLTRHERGKYVIIQDALELYGRHLLMGIVKNFLKEGTSVYVLCCDSMHKDDWKNKAAFDGKLSAENLQICDHYSDPCGWNSDAVPKVDEILIDAVAEVKSRTNAVIVIDSMSTLLFWSTARKLYRTLCNILTNDGNNVQILALLHADAHGEETLSLLSSLATCTLTILPLCNGNPVMSCVSHHPRGKILNQIVQYQINENFELKFVSDIPETKNLQPAVKHPDPTANLTFNLKLKDNEKEVRNKLQLPYMKINPEVPEILNEDDFYEEDDPDDDLDV